ncbi:MAG TPA: anthranilate phosphoribosyltransferase, partial [Thermoanaerobaculia bacterium]|nr:anthranilate phosphoribosyltransferase [Thermoanaerobaculia bacterium]
VRTVFNILGPLTNPAFAPRQVLGVYDLSLVPLVAGVLLELGSEHAMVVHSRDGLDEISISAPTEVCEVSGGAIRSYLLHPGDMGIESYPLEAIAGGDAAENAAIARRVLDGEEGAYREVVVANSGAALYVSGVAASIREGVDLAREALSSGRAAVTLDRLVEISNRTGETRG